VLDQEGVDVELLVMDPGSTDGSRELLQALQQEYGGKLRLHFARTTARPMLSITVWPWPAARCSAGSIPTTGCGRGRCGRSSPA